MTTLSLLLLLLAESSGEAHRDDVGQGIFVRQQSPGGPVHDPVRFPVSPKNLARVFFQVLAEHGDWLVIDGAGLVWRPSAAKAGKTFVPFVTGGVWLRGADGWQFESRFPWGGIVFRYGTWVRDFNDTWVWIPGARQASRGGMVDPRYSALDDPRFIPPLVRSIRFPEGVQFAYPLGQSLGRVFPEGTEVRYPPGNIGGAKDHTVLVPENLIGQPLQRFQVLRSR